ncbi:hypothetical protein BDV37DRAFT_289932 [Aspergillus pseudonomiae]|uniref:Uncharacterized protein n=1 Tax=Aspergillus pseudonomiae TaxID=1506151 RepID=A0A5N7CRL6_9EURO|nr:uncharacterized protein BDV37DRAFT_289932 [Aspergillus pseudonomiae]KAE8396841.1 hypothetical protein BDV37DRAFT_289932 [Aspergillus pseudonomiae]
MPSPVLFADMGNRVYYQPGARVGIALVQPTITVERDDPVYYISARFILETVIVEPQPMPKRKWHFLNLIHLTCQSHHTDVCLPESDATPAMKITSTQSRGWQAGGGVTAGPTPGGNVNFSIVGNITITRDTQTGSWGLVAFKEPLHNVWHWESKTKTLGYVPDDVKTSMRRAITVTRTRPIATVNAENGPVESFNFRVIIVPSECGHGFRFNAFHYWQQCTNSDPERGFHTIWNHGEPGPAADIQFTLLLNQTARPHLPLSKTIRLNEQLASLISSNKPILPGSLVDHIQANEQELFAYLGAAPMGRCLIQSRYGASEIINL